MPHVEFNDAPKKLFMVPAVFFEPWDWTNSTGEPGSDGKVRGIGGSETQQTEVAWRMAQRGWEVTSYSLTPWSGIRKWRNVTWTDVKNVDFTEPGVWMIYRSPELLDNFTADHPGQVIWFCAQDESYPSFTAERIAKVDFFQAICFTHAQHTASMHPELASKIVVVPNGVKVDLIRQIEAEGLPQRNPRRLMWASSPDRGLLYLLKIFRRAREWVSGLELYVAYSFRNIDKLIATGDQRFYHYKKLKDKILSEADQPGVVWLDRISQPELYREWFKTGILAHPSMFTETGFITICEAQAMGAIPITNPIWAAREYCLNGVFIQGDCYNDPLVQARYVGEIYRLATNPKLQEEIRHRMMQEARETFNWERVVDRIEAHLLGLHAKDRMIHCQANFQLKYSKGKILNIGCADDPAKLKLLGAVNLDVCAEHPTLRTRNACDVVHDARTPLPFKDGCFDTVVFGDILEHMTKPDAIKALTNARKVIKGDGHVVITVPDDHRDPHAQNIYESMGQPFTEEYTNGVKGYHRPISREEILDTVLQAGLQPKVIQPIDYGIFVGHGIVATKVSQEAA